MLQPHLPELEFRQLIGMIDTREATAESLIRIAGTRWAIEECFQAAKTEVGLDQYQMRRYDAWCHHITLVLGERRLLPAFSSAGLLYVCDYFGFRINAKCLVVTKTINKPCARNGKVRRCRHTKRQKLVS